jgi:signal transduction histidine kinase
MPLSPQEKVGAMTIAPLLLAMMATVLAFSASARFWRLRPAVTAGAPTPPMLASVAPGSSPLRHAPPREASGPPRMLLHLRPVPLGPLVERAIGVALRTARPGLRHWQVDAALRRRVVAADADALESALTALLRRAVVHSRDGDIIALRWFEATDTVAIVVEDEGDGLPGLGAELDEAGTVTCLGIGLHHARSLAAAQGGDVRLEAAPGIGARAWLTLPRDRLLETT